MSETAFEMFSRTAQAEELPAAVPVAFSNGELTGIMTTRFDVRNNKDALAVATSDDPRQRAVCAVYACRAAREAAELHYQDLHAV